jgi:hypothetical protein
MEMTRPALDLAALRHRHIFIATPLYANTMTLGYHTSFCNLMKLCAKNGISMGVKYIGCDSLVPRARNRLYAYFRHSPATDIFFIDSDISFSAEDVLSLVQRPEPILGGVYPRKQFDWPRIAAAARANIPPAELSQYGFIPVSNWAGPGDYSLSDPIPMHHLGTGFLRIRRECLDDIVRQLGEQIQFDYSSDESVFKGEIGYDLFPCGPDVRYPVGSRGRQYLSEDWGFSELAKHCGYTLHAAPWVSLTHSGYCDYFGSLDIMDAAIEDALNAAAPVMNVAPPEEDTLASIP